MPLLCSICKKPIGPHDVAVKVEGRWVHVRHPGVVETYRIKPGDCSIGPALFKDPPTRMTFGDPPRYPKTSHANR